MSGIYFLGTQKYDDLKDFYLRQVGCSLWLEQEDCCICRHGNFLFGFCRRDQVAKDGILCFFYDRREEVDRMYEKFKTIALTPPELSDKYRVYHFFVTDPEGRKVEFQYFDHAIDRHRCGDVLLTSRRSVRKFLPTEISAELLEQVIEICRFAPTSRNTQSYYFKLIRDRELLRRLSEVRGKSSAPIAAAPLAVAICADPELSKRHVQDGCIAAYHLLLAAWHCGLGTCWIAAMDRPEVKEMLEIPEQHYVATITPLGYPERLHKEAPARHEASWFVR